MQDAEGQHMDRGGNMNCICRGWYGEIRVKFAGNRRIKNSTHVLFCFSVSGLPALQKMKPFRKVRNVSQRKVSFSVLFSAIKLARPNLDDQVKEDRTQINFYDPCSN